MTTDEERAKALRLSWSHLVTFPTMSAIKEVHASLVAFAHAERKRALEEFAERCDKHDRKYLALAIRHLAAPETFLGVTGSPRPPEGEGGA